MNRFFIGIFPPEAILNELEGLCWGLQNAKWQPREKFHITLEFLGEVAPHLRRDLQSALAQVHFDPFPIKVKGLGHFPLRKTPGVLWAGVESAEELVRLQQQVRGKLRSLSGITLESRKYHPHITLARIRDVRDTDLAGYYQSHPLFALPAFEVEGFNLVKSTLHHGGSRYEVVESFL